MCFFTLSSVAYFFLQEIHLKLIAWMSLNSGGSIFLALVEVKMVHCLSHSFYMLKIYKRKSKSFVSKYDDKSLFVILTIFEI